METEASRRVKKTNLHKIAHLIRYVFLAVLVGLYGWLMISDSIPLLGFAILAVLALPIGSLAENLAFQVSLIFRC